MGGGPVKAARHVMIRASAGSGKTHALTDRFVELLAHGAAPERIVALTFTRKAAGEFFDEILNKLARAAGDPESARRLAAGIGRPQWTQGDFLRLLRTVVEAMPMLRLGTLDGFFARIARSFPLELGLAGKFELLEEHGARVGRARVLRRMFAHYGGLDDAQKEFVEAFKRATFGREEKKLGAQLDAFLDDHHEKYLAAPDAELWGNARRIWPEGNRWLGAKSDLRAALAVLRRWLEESDQAEKQRRRWLDFFSAVENWRPGAPPPPELAYVLKKALARWDELKAAGAELEFDRKKQLLSASAGKALAEIAANLAGGEMARRIETTRGIHAVLRSYEATYHDTVRRAGRLTFADVQRLLMPGGGGPVLTGEDTGGEGRLYIDYRVDAEIDHWLLDEFQDTSVGQWSVLGNLIDEAVQDPSGARTFFCVGDVKQAIFTWREGDPRLFRDVLDRYNAMAPGTISEGKLVDSWRSGPALIAMVNAVFGDGAAIGELFPPRVAEAWNREWSDHHSAVAGRTGQSALIFADDEAARRARMLDLLREIRPIERGLSCAVLVQKNATATEVAEVLREAGIPALAESDLHVCTDNPVGAALLALVKAAAHPGDTLAWEHVRMTPLGAALTAAGIDTPGGLAGAVLGRIHARGFEATVGQWWARLEEQLPATDAFSRLRAKQIAEAARIFDETGSRDVTEFAAFMERHTVRDADRGSVVRVMTVHKSKGLGFDVVILPDLEGRKLDQRRKGLAVRKGPGGAVDWVLDLPGELFRENDPVLSDYVAEAEGEAGYEALALLYVAMTRAKRAMYAIVKPAGDSKSLNYPRLLTETLGGDPTEVAVGELRLSGSWRAGDPNWHGASGPLKTEPTAPDPIVPVNTSVARRANRHPARRPSDGTDGAFSAAPLFGIATGKSLDFGARVHEVFAEVEWLEPGDVARLEKAWAGRGVAAEVIEAASRCLRAEEMSAVWKRPANGAGTKLWRERAFEVVVDGVWFTGVFDRVVLETGADGKASRAWVIDFKTDRFAGNEEVARLVTKHSSQLNLYRRAAALLSGLPAREVACSLVFTAGPKMVEVPHPA